MLTLKTEGLGCALFLGAHADDIEIGCGGTVLNLVAAAPHVKIGWVVLSGGAGVRAQEARRSAERFLAGAENVTVEVLEYPDALFPTRYAELKDEMARIREEIRPDIVFTHRREDAHQDHRLLGELAWGAFRNEWILEYEIPKYEGDLGAPNVFVPLTQETMDAKLAVLWECFETQREKPWFSKEQLGAAALLRGLEAKGGARYAEAFYSRKAILSFEAESQRVRID